MNDKQLNQLIDRYFEGDTSASEEAQLWRVLAEGSHTSPQAQEALAVMAYARSRSAKPAGRFKPMRLRAASLAASIALVGGIAAYMWPNADYGYTAGRQITDKEQALMLMDADIHAFSMASANVSKSIEADLSLFSFAINDINSN